MGFFNRRTKLQAERGLGADRPLEAARFQRSVNVPMKAEYRNAVGNRMFVNAQAAHWSNRFPLYPTQTRSSSVEGLPAGRLKINTGDYTNVYDYYHFRTLTKPQASGNVTRHTLKVGIEAYRERLGAVARRALSEWGSGCSVGSDVRALRGLRRSARPRSARCTGWAESYDSVLQLFTS